MKEEELSAKEFHSHVGGHVLTLFLFSSSILYPKLTLLKANYDFALPVAWTINEVFKLHVLKVGGKFQSSGHNLEVLLDTHLPRIQSKTGRKSVGGTTSLCLRLQICDWKLNQHDAWLSQPRELLCCFYSRFRGVSPHFCGRGFLDIWCWFKEEIQVLFQNT